MLFCVIVKDRRREMQAASGTDHEPETIDRYSAVLEGSENELAVTDFIVRADRRHD